MPFYSHGELGGGLDIVSVSQCNPEVLYKTENSIVCWNYDSNEKKVKNIASQNWIHLQYDESQETILGLFLDIERKLKCQALNRHDFSIISTLDVTLPESLPAHFTLLFPSLKKNQNNKLSFLLESKGSSHLLSIEFQEKQFHQLPSYSFSFPFYCDSFHFDGVRLFMLSENRTRYRIILLTNAVSIHVLYEHYFSSSITQAQLINNSSSMFLSSQGVVYETYHPSLLATNYTLWQLERDKAKSDITMDEVFHDKDVTAFAVHPNGTTLFFAKKSSEILICHTSLSSSTHINHVEAFGMQIRGRRVVDVEGVISMDQLSPTSIVNPYAPSIKSLQLCFNNSHLVCLSETPNLMVFDVTSRSPISYKLGHLSEIQCFGPKYLMSHMNTGNEKKLPLVTLSTQDGSIISWMLRSDRTENNVGGHPIDTKQQAPQRLVLPSLNFSPLQDNTVISPPMMISSTLSSCWERELYDAREGVYKGKQLMASSFTFLYSTLAIVGTDEGHLVVCEWKEKEGGANWEPLIYRTFPSSLRQSLYDNLLTLYMEFFSSVKDSWFREQCLVLLCRSRNLSCTIYDLKEVVEVLLHQYLAVQRITSSLDGKCVAVEYAFSGTEILHVDSLEKGHFYLGEEQAENSFISSVLEREKRFLSYLKINAGEEKEHYTKEVFSWIKETGEIIKDTPLKDQEKAVVVESMTQRKRPRFISSPRASSYCLLIESDEPDQLLILEYANASIVLRERIKIKMNDTEDNSITNIQQARRTRIIDYIIHANSDYLVGVAVLSYHHLNPCDYNTSVIIHDSYIFVYDMVSKMIINKMSFLPSSWNLIEGSESKRSRDWEFLFSCGQVMPSTIESTPCGSFALIHATLDVSSEFTGGMASDEEIREAINSLLNKEPHESPIPEKEDPKVLKHIQDLFQYTIDVLDELDPPSASQKPISGQPLLSSLTSTVEDSLWRQHQRKKLLGRYKEMQCEYQKKKVNKKDGERPSCSPSYTLEVLLVYSFVHSAFIGITLNSVDSHSSSHNSPQRLEGYRTQKDKSKPLVPAKNVTVNPANMRTFFETSSETDCIQIKAFNEQLCNIMYRNIVQYSRPPNLFHISSLNKLLMAQYWRRVFSQEEMKDCDNSEVKTPVTEYEFAKGVEADVRKRVTHNRNYNVQDREALLFEEIENTYKDIDAFDRMRDSFDTYSNAFDDQVSLYDSVH